MKFQPLTGSEKPKSFWGNFRGKRGFLLDQLAERVKNNINFEDYWTDKDDLAIAKIISEVIYGHTRIKIPLLPDDPIELVWFVVDPPALIDDLLLVEIFMDIEDRCNCAISEVSFEKMKTFADFVAVVKSSPPPSPPTPREKVKTNWWGVGCFTVWAAVTLLIVYFLMF